MGLSVELNSSIGQIIKDSGINDRTALFPLSDTTDGVNVENMFALRQWQSWIDEMERTGNYPDFGESCGDYELQNLADSPQLAQIYDNGAAKYQFPARLVYTEG